MPNTAQILLVEPDDASRESLRAAASDLGNVESCATFEAARARLMASRVDFLVTNIRLGAFNGLHLVYLSQFSERAGAPRAIVYNDGKDIGLAREAQRAGAFYVESLPVSLAGYLDGALPERERRDPAFRDRGTASNRRTPPPASLAAR
jgi:DNA-binding NtrC family response regulator